MAKWRDRDGFDYYVEGDEASQFGNNFQDDDQYIPGNRFQKKNKYTGEVQGKKQFINTSSIYTNNGIPPQGTIEFSAIPGQGGLNPNQRPLGDQTMVFNGSQNPYMQQSYQQQVQRDAAPVAQSPVNQTQTSTITYSPDQPTVVVQQVQKRKYKMSKWLVILLSILVLVAFGMIVFGVLLLLGIISF